VCTFFILYQTINSFYDVLISFEMAQFTLAVIKPDAVRAGNAEEIKQLIELHGFTIIIQQKFQVCF